MGDRVWGDQGLNSLEEKLEEEKVFENNSEEPRHMTMMLRKMQLDLYQADDKKKREIPLPIDKNTLLADLPIKEFKVIDHFHKIIGTIR